jgi:thimet oligopeptidase
MLHRVVRRGWLTLMSISATSAALSSGAPAMMNCVGALCHQPKTFATMTSSSTLGALPADLRFDLDAETIGKHAEAMMSAQTAAHDAVAAVPVGGVTWHNTVSVLVNVDNSLHARGAALVLPMYTHVEKSVRDASSAANAQLDKHAVELTARRDVYERLAALRAKADSGAEKLDAAQRRLLGKMCEDCERQGVALPAEAAARLTAINKRIAELSVEFQKALNEENERLLFSEAELAGLSPDFVNNLPRDEASGKRVVTLKYTDLFPVLKQATVENTRRVVEEANSAKCPANVALIEEVLTLRLEAARLLGFKSDSEFQLAVLMAKTPEAVRDFLGDLDKRLTPKADAERAELLELKREMCAAANQPFDGKLYSHDWRFFQQQLQTKKFNVDEEAVKAYFPFEHVATTMFDLYQHLFHVRFAEIKPGTPNHRVWHPDVLQYVVTDASNGAELGSFFLDLHPREGKYGHACVMPLVPTFVDETKNNTRNPLVAAMLANFSKPTADKPSLLYHDEVVTFYHEFGHAIHGIVSQARFARFSGTSVERDFVECRKCLFLCLFSVFFFFASNAQLQWLPISHLAPVP